MANTTSTTATAHAPAVWRLKKRANAPIQSEAAQSPHDSQKGVWRVQQAFKETF
ncbi:hypothetical protein AA0473_2062 [Acetobacter orleanensis NRIC 0473]|uniref:Uncharacterized protein n=1 Tax=Acetobacter orleanensis TaxID=104099 RepID=A0A4Y3TLX0_9PROT|nr:hypothetical protein Abol_015_229 [Acetobacter orleanensis JCM 7639]GBR29623.1 hypothetical protein AA0473_2062 [Acetobacter orleanensis NRIC 0473]GEB82764.1 hypothetical protein AOR01nite_12410 [Acetobacter orleanensis]